MRASPCKDCPKKGCGAYHSACKDYQEWNEENVENRLKRLRASRNNDALKAMELLRNKSVAIYGGGAIRHGKSKGGHRENG